VEPGADTIARLREEIAALRERALAAERNTARTLVRATRLGQVISVLAQDTELDAIVERAAVQLGELFGADVALLALGPDDALQVAGHYGMRPRDLPGGAFALPCERQAAGHVSFGPAEEVPVPAFLERYGALHVAWARLVVGEESLGQLMLVRRGPSAFERSDADELRAIAYRIALAIENGRLHRRTREQLVRLRRLHDITKELAGTIELDVIGRRLAEVLVSEVPVQGCALSVVRLGALEGLSRAGVADPEADWEDLPLQAAGTSVGRVAIADAPKPGTEAHETLEHLLGIAALALQKALLYERSQEQARRDSLTGLLGHQAFQERLEGLIARDERFSVALLDIDDFKQVNDLHGHLTGDETLRRVAEAMRGAARSTDELFRVGGEEFCVVLRDAGTDDAFPVAERLRRGVAAHAVHPPVTISVGLAGHPEHGTGRDELLAAADVALYASKRTGKNRTTVAGADLAPHRARSDREVRLALLHEKDPDTVVHCTHVATLAVDVARCMALPDERLADLRTAAMLHDVGKIAIPDEVLLKPEPLAEDERRLVQVHPVVGASMMRAWGLAGAARFVEEHHEHVDGGGYPRGLAGEEIALESRIIHVVDAYMAMTLDRPYRAAMSAADAIAELERHSGRQFDPAVVGALLEVLAVPLARAA
jgi:diguanylate cyclase (GGDEF)-like protein/putative nucleotidyltransferase with HDIG domain